MRKQVQEVISLPPEKLSSIREHINQLLQKEVGNSSAEGIITDISDVSDITSLFISRVNGHSHFRVHYWKELIKPEEGSIYTAHVDRIYEEGLFCSIHNIDILIPAPRMVNWHFNGQCVTKYFQHSKGKTISVGDDVRLRVIAVRYDKKYQCLADLIFGDDD